MRYDSQTHSSDSEFISENIKSQLENQITENLDNNIIYLRKLFSNSADFVTKRFNINQNNIIILYCEGMINLQLVGPLIIEPINQIKFNQKNLTPKNLFNYLEREIIVASDKNLLFNYNDIFMSIMSGNIVILIDGVASAISIEITGFQMRSITESVNEVDIRSPKESFIEPLRINLTMIRRRIKSPTLKFDNMVVGKTSQTSVSLIYLTDVANSRLVEKIKRKLTEVTIDVLLDSTYLATFLAEKKYSVLPEIGYSERPDVVCGKISEGRVAILVDGCPHAIIVPHLFIESFQTMDDYTNRPVYTSFMRFLRFASFFISILMPGVYVAISSFHPEMFPQTLLFNVALSQDITPFPIMVEALLIHFIYDLMREAGLRLPRQIGYAVSIVGALVIGESAVSSGIIGAPMVIIVALTAITSFIMTTIYQTVCILKFVFIILGGLGGLYGITLGVCFLLLNMSSMNTFDVPYLSPISPLNSYFWGDTFIKRNWKYMSKQKIKIQDLPGVKKYK
ncbi:MAG: spore germination protein [Oscillospiraceae bacterium]|nr:spore germination protein [Oscillospiraceae bacterium]